MQKIRLFIPSRFLENILGVGESGAKGLCLWKLSQFIMTSPENKPATNLWLQSQQQKVLIDGPLQGALNLLQLIFYDCCFVFLKSELKKNVKV